MTCFRRWLLLGALFLSACGELDGVDRLDELDENGCYPGEVYDPVDDTCYLDCDTEAECQALEEPAFGEVDTTDPARNSLPDDETATGQTDVFLSDEEPATDLEANDDLDNEPGQDRIVMDDDMVQLAHYQVGNGLEVTLLNLIDGPAEATSEYEETWAVISTLLPPDILAEEVYEFWVFSDGPDGTLAYVEPLANDPARWLMAIDPADVRIVDGELSDDVLHTIVHEFAHILTLEDTQVTPDPENDGQQLSMIAETCTTFYTGEGCAEPDSYINQFFYAFWEDLFDRTLDSEDIADESEREDAVYAFYEEYPDQFLTDYAATNPGEDIAESFAFYVLDDGPTGKAGADEKISFFDNYPQMVAIRAHIREQSGQQ